MSFTFNGISSDTYNIKVEKCPSYPVASRVVEHIAVPGRNGDLIRDTGAWSNVDMTYSVYYDGSASSFQTVSHSIASWLNGSFGYCRLEDTYDPDVYRMAVMSNYTDYRNFLNKKGRADITFSCKPQRFLKSGESFTNLSGTVSNPYMDCFPIYEVGGNGSVTINGHTFTVSGNLNGITYVDSETGEAWSGNFEMRKQEFPIVSLSSNNSSVSVPFTLNTTGLTSSLYWNTWITNAGNTHYHGTDITNTSSASLSYIRGVSPTDSYNVSVTRASGSNTVVFTLNSGGPVEVRTVVTTTDNRNENVKGDIVGIPHGSATASKTANSLRYMPRWWVL